MLRREDNFCIFSGQFKHLTGQTKFDQTNFLYIVNGVSNSKTSVRIICIATVFNVVNSSLITINVYRDPMDSCAYTIKQLYFQKSFCLTAVVLSLQAHTNM